jgi:hypothetical protein
LSTGVYIEARRRLGAAQMADLNAVASIEGDRLVAGAEAAA